MTWVTVPLGSLITPAPPIRLGTREGVPILSMTMREGLVDQSSKFKKRVAGDDISGYKVVRRGQLVVGFPIDEAVLAFQHTHIEGIVSPAYGVWDVRDERVVDRLYLERFLRSTQAIGYYKAKLRGTTLRRRSLPRPVFEAMQVPLPPLPEQRRIAAILDEANATRSARHSQTESLAALVELRVQALVASAPSTRHFAELLAEPLRNGISPSRTGRFPGEVLTLSAITHGRFDAAAKKADSFTSPHSPAKLVTAGLHLICRGNGNRDLVGSMAVVPETMNGVAFPDTMIATRPTSVIGSTALAAAWRSPFVRDQLLRGAATTNGTYKVNQQLLESIRVPVPSTSSQEQIEALEAELGAVRSQLDASSAALDTLFASLQHRAFRGEL